MKVFFSGIILVIWGLHIMVDLLAAGSCWWLLGLAMTIGGGYVAVDKLIKEL